MRRTSIRFAAALLVVFGLLSTQAIADEVSGRAIYLQTLKGTGRIEAQKSFGTGWVIDAEQRLMVTNHHVVENEPFVTVTFAAYENGRPIADPAHYQRAKKIRARVLDTDPTRDLAVIQLARLPEGVTALPIAPESPMPGDSVFLVGNPGASSGYWVFTSGAVRQVVRKSGRLENNQGFDARVIETTMAINPGDSGSAVVNAAGEVVGVTSAFRRQANTLSWAVDRSEINAYLSEVRALRTPDTAEAVDFEKRGLRHLAAMRLAPAIADFTEALKRDDTLALSHRERGWATHLKGDNAAALADLDQAIRLNPKDASAWNSRGIVLAAQKEFDKAIEDFSQAIRLQPKLAAGHLNRADAYHSKRAFPEAIRDLDTLVKILPGDNTVLKGRARCYFDIGRLEQAAADLTEALKANPNDAGALDALGQVFEAAGDFEKADRFYSDAIKLAPKLEAHTKVRSTKAVTVTNNTGQKIYVVATFEMLTKDGRWEWLPGEGKVMYWPLEAGETQKLYCPLGRVEARRIRIWAMTTDLQRQWGMHRHQEMTLLRTSYRLRNTPEYVHTIEPMISNVGAQAP